MSEGWPGPELTTGRVRDMEITDDGDGNPYDPRIGGPDCVYAKIAASVYDRGIIIPDSICTAVRSIIGSEDNEDNEVYNPESSRRIFLTDDPIGITIMYEMSPGVSGSWICFESDRIVFGSSSPIQYVVELSPDGEDGSYFWRKKSTGGYTTPIEPVEEAVRIRIFQIVNEALKDNDIGLVNYKIFRTLN